MSDASEVGLEVANLPCVFARSKIASGALHRVFEDWTLPPFTVYVASRPKLARVRRVRAFMTYLPHPFLFFWRTDASGNGSETDSSFKQTYRRPLQAARTRPARRTTADRS